MDALPMDEIHQPALALDHSPARFHGCGHDGHTTMLLGAARYLAETRDFKGTAVFVFQPAEEGLGGARAMIADGCSSASPATRSTGCTIRPISKPARWSVFPGPCHGRRRFLRYQRSRAAAAMARCRICRPRPRRRRE
jgi:metal-dependent amidase/aminoacylase/carboxypeptidase family protein